MRITFVALAMLAFLGSPSSADDRPNILILMADDLGHSDIGCFGGEIETPNIDQIAEEGMQFTHFRATPMCVTSRVALMAGMPFNRAGKHNYAHSSPLPLILRQAGYRTMMTGKWHGGVPDPMSGGMFDRSFGFLGGATDSFRGGKDWFLDDKRFSDFDDDFYATSEFADKSIEFMKEAIASEQPFFMYVAFNAPHHPCQAPRPTVDKYKDRYRAGYESVRRERHQRQVESGLVDPNWRLAEQGAEVRRWDELSEHRRDVESGRMAAYAAAVDEVDQSIGRLLTFLRDADIDQNTLVIFLSDNGGDYNNGSLEGDEHQVAWKPGSNPSSSNGWAAVKCTPFRFYKHACHEGGIATPMVLRWPAGINRDAGQRIDAATCITDIYPTVLELAEAALPTEHANKKLRTLTGASLVPLFQSNGKREIKPVFRWYAFSAAWIEHPWKATRLYDGPWQLFDLANDRTEVDDLAEKYPERLEQMVASWEAFAAEADVPNSSDVAKNGHRGWGWHRLKMSCPELESLHPENGSVTCRKTTGLQMKFNAAIDFRGTPNRAIRLYEVGDESKPVWHSDPDPTHIAQGKMTLTFDELPTLKPDTHYRLQWDPGWIKVGGRPVGQLNDGAYWWRFRTAKAETQ